MRLVSAGPIILSQSCAAEMTGIPPVWLSTVNLKGRNKQTPTWLLSKVLDGHARLEAYQQWMKEIGVDHRE